MASDLFIGKRVRLTARDPEKDALTVSQWGRDTNYLRLLEGEPVMPPVVQEWRKRFESAHRPDWFPFLVHTLEPDALIGFVVLIRVSHTNGDAYVGIGIGEDEYRSKGYGTEIMALVLRFAFQELNLHRVSLDAVASNARAIRSYKKVGFVHEGQTRGTDFRDGARGNMVAMGILQSEWARRRGEGDK